jgi:hypothetical protein
MMMMEGKNTARKVSKSIAVYAIWMAFAASQVGLALWIHDVIFSATLLLARNAWVPRAVDMWSMFVLGMVVLGSIFVTEAYLNKGMLKQQFWKRVGIVALIEGAIALVLLGVQSLLLS